MGSLLILFHADVMLMTGADSWELQLSHPPSISSGGTARGATDLGGRSPFLTAGLAGSPSSAATISKANQRQPLPQGGKREIRSLAFGGDEADSASEGMETTGGGSEDGDDVVSGTSYLIGHRWNSLIISSLLAKNCCYSENLPWSSNRPQPPPRLSSTGPRSSSSPA